MKIPFAPPSLCSSDFKHVEKALKSKWLTSGAYNLKFEKFFSKITKNKFCLSLNSCTSALEIAIKILDLKKNSEILIPSFTWVSTANAVINCGHKVSFCDVDINSRSITLEILKKSVTKNTKAVIIVHYAGLVYDMDRISNFCKKKKIKIIEDSAETIGGYCNSKHPGSWGLGCFSFFPTKNITTGEGGMLTVQNIQQFNKAKALIAHGISSTTLERDKKKNTFHKEAILPGHNFRLSNINAALGFSQIKKLKKLNQNRRKIAKIYNEHLASLPIQTPAQPLNSFHVYQMYTILVPSKIRSDLISFFKKYNINTGVHFYPPVHRHKFYKSINKKKNKLQNTEYLSKSILSLPIYPDMTAKHALYVCEKLKIFFLNHNTFK